MGHCGRRRTSTAALCWPKTPGATTLPDNVPEFLDQELFEAWASRPLWDEARALGLAFPDGRCLPARVRSGQPEARWALEHVDGVVATLLAELDTGGRLESSDVIVVGDHGFVEVANGGSPLILRRS